MNFQLVWERHEGNLNFFEFFQYFMDLRLMLLSIIVFKKSKFLNIKSLENQEALETKSFEIKEDLGIQTEFIASKT